MATLVFDIETAGLPWEQFDTVTKNQLTHWVEKTSMSSTEKETRLNQLKDDLGLSPFTGEIVALGVYDIERTLGAVYYQGAPFVYEEGEFAFKARTEKEMLEDFWESARSYDSFISFGGRAFDIPFILHRSIAHQVKPTVEFPRKRYITQQAQPYHVDLQDECTFYGALVKRPSLHMVCRTYGIPSPKETVTGADVAKLFQMKKFRDIAEYNAKDVQAITSLYDIWKRNLAPASYINLLEM